MTDKMREEFEKWWKSERAAMNPPAYVKESAWITWQACAARMVPKKKVLPELLLAEHHEAKGWNACVDSILAAAPEGKK